jgi:cytochrome c
VVLFLSVLAGGCRGRGDRLERDGAAALTGGDAARGVAAVRRYGCDACHSIPGVPGADRKVGPSLAGIDRRMYIGGVLPNSPGNLIRWIRAPREVDPNTAMPNLGVTQQDARDIAAYLYTLR